MFQLSIHIRSHDVSSNIYIPNKYYTFTNYTPKYSLHIHTYGYDIVRSLPSLTSYYFIMIIICIYIIIRQLYFENTTYYNTNNHNRHKLRKISKSTKNNIDCDQSLSYPIIYS